MNAKLTRSVLAGALLVGSLFAGNNGSGLRPRVTIHPEQNSQFIQINFPAENPSAWQALLADPESFSSQGYGFQSTTSELALPAFTVLVPVAENVQSVPRVTLGGESLRQLEQIQFAHRPALRRETDPKAAVHFISELPSADESQGFSVGTPVVMGRQTVVPITVYPLKLDADHGVRVREQVRLILHAPPPEDGESMAQYRHAMPTPDGIFQQLGAYLIITPPVFIPYLNNLVEWKQRKGHPVTVVSTETFSPLTPEVIRGYIRDAYLTWATPPRYVLLVGDVDQGMPTFYIQNPEGVSRVTDHPYGLLTGDDDFPELMVGRLSVDSFYELLVISAKIVRHESNPYNDGTDWLKRGLMVCTTVAAQSTAHTKNWVRNKMLAYDYTRVDTAYFPQQGSLNYILNPINNGVGLLNYRGLGHYDGWSGPFMNSAEIDYLNNGWKLPIVTSIVCGGGNFGASQDPCFGEKWIRAGTTSSPKGAVAFFGPSELYTHTMYNNAIDVGIYHAIFDLGIDELGEALWQGKLELWRNYHQNGSYAFGQAPEFYFHVYNLLGDPGLRIWTDTPREIVVSHPDSMQFGDRSITVQVTEADGTPVQGAFVFIQSVMNALGYETDAQGRVSLPVVVDGSDLNLTVTGRNLDPYLASIPVSETPHAFSVIDIGWQDEAPITGGDEGQLRFVLEGGPEQVSDVELSLECNSPWVRVIQAHDMIPVVAGGAILEFDSNLAIRLEPDTPDSTLVFLRISMDTGSEERVEQLPLLLHGARLVLPPVEVLSGTTAPGDSVQVQFSLENRGSFSTGAGAGALAYSQGVSGNVNTLNWPSLEPGETYIFLDPVVLRFDESLFPGDKITAMLIPGADTLVQTFSLVSPGAYDPSAPDAYGYRVFDNMDLAYSKAPEFAWYEIDRMNTGPGQPLPIYDPEDERDAAIVVDLPFPVKFYGRVYHEVTICSNGWLAMGRSGDMSFRNRTIPSPMGPAAMLAPFWDDLYTSPGRVSHYAVPDGSRYIVEWKDMANAYTGQLESFQIVIFNNGSTTPTGDHEILFLYQEFNNVDGYENYATVGIESPDYSTGVQVTYANQYDASLLPLGAERALLFTTARGTRLPAAAIMVDRTELNFTVNPWDWQTDSIAITNVGESPLLYTISPVNPGAMSRENGAPAAGSRPDLLPKGAAELLVQRSERDSVDAFGYRWRDENDPATPQFAWVDIEQPPHLLPNPDDPDDVIWGPLPVGFEFPFYEARFDEIWVSSNGFLTFNDFEGLQFYNWPLPSVNAPGNLIAAWWDDLNGGTSITGNVYARSNGVDSCVITFREIPRWGTTTTYTFQAILEIDGTITLQYAVMNGPRTSATVGIQNSTASVGLTALYNQYNDLSAGSVIQFLRPHSWFNPGQLSGTVAAGETEYFAVRVITRGMDPGQYEMPLHLMSNAGNDGEIPLTVHMNVEQGSPPPGDVNLDYRVNILDFNLLLELIIQQADAAPEQIEAGDLYPDGQLDVLDLVHLLELILNPSPAVPASLP